jgi:hypothetical protein
MNLELWYGFELCQFPLFFSNYDGNILARFELLCSFHILIVIYLGSFRIMMFFSHSDGNIFARFQLWCSFRKKNCCRIYGLKSLMGRKTRYPLCYSWQRRGRFFHLQIGTDMEESFSSILWHFEKQCSRCLYIFLDVDGLKPKSLRCTSLTVSLVSSWVMEDDSGHFFKASATVASLSTHCLRE